MTPGPATLRPGGTRTSPRRTRPALAALIGTGAILASLGAAQAAPPSLCVSTNGTERVQRGTATCSSVAGPGNVAKATGEGSTAQAGFTDGDARNRATASGTNSAAFAGFGDGNRATASADGSFAGAGSGDGNRATAGGDGSEASAFDGDGNIAVASAAGSVAEAFNGDGNTAIATSAGCFASASGGAAASAC